MSENVTFNGGKPDLATQQPVEQGDSAKLSLLNSFQGHNNTRYSRGSSNKTQFYRKINHYTKSKTQYWNERKRRKQAWKLSSEGFTYKQIGKKLGVSEKTVQRDMKKVRRYHIGQLNKSWRIMQEEQIAAYEKKLEGLNPAQRFKVTTALLCDYMDRKREREYNRHLIKITIDMDNLIKGVLPRIHTWPKNNFKVTFPLHLHLAYQVEGETIRCGGFTIG